MSRNTALLILFIVGACPGQADPRGGAPWPGQWNQWRGPARDAQAPGAWPERLKQTDLESQWRVPLGPSYSGPVVDAERVYTTQTVDKKFEVVTAHDRATGEKLWEARWEGAMAVPFFARRNGSWIRSTPALVDGRLYVAGMEDLLVCLDAETGTEIWRVDFKKRFKSPRPTFGFVCSPLVDDGHVYVQAGGGLVKLTADSGKTVWRSLNDGGGMMGSAFSSPVFATIRGTRQLLVQTRVKLCGVDPSDGKELWSVPIKTFRGMNILTPAPFGDAVFTSAYQGKGHLFDVSKRGDGFSIKERWSNRAQAYMSSPVVIKGHAYLYLRANRFCCVNLETGKMTWRTGPIGDDYWSLVANGDRILALSNSGELYHIAADDKEYRLLDRVRISDGQTWAHLAVDGDQIIVRELDGLAAFRWKRGDSEPSDESR